MCRNLGNVKQKPTRKTCFPMKKATGFTHLQGNFLPGDISLKSTESLLYFYKKQMLQRGRVFAKDLIIKD